MTARLARPTLTVRGWAVLSAGLGLVVSGAWLGFVDVVRLGSVAICLVALTLAHLSIPHPSVEVERWVAGEVLAVNHRSTVRVGVRNASRRHWPAGTVMDASTTGMSLHPSATPEDSQASGPATWRLAPLAPGESATIEYAALPLRRGRHALGPLLVARGDPFGLATRSSAVSTPTPVVAAPAPEDLGPPLDLNPTVRDAGDDPGTRSARASTRSDAALRDYRQGDDLRRVHWPASAHRGDLIVRDDETPSSELVVIVLEPTAVSATPRALDRALTVLTSVVCHLQERDHPMIVVTPEADGGQIVAQHGVDALRTLALVDVDPSPRAPHTSPVDAPSAVAAAARELIPGASLWVSAVGGDATAASRLFEALPAGVAGACFVIPDDGDDSAQHIADLGAGFGWSTTVVSYGPGQVAAAWQRLVERDGTS